MKGMNHIRKTKPTAVSTITDVPPRTVRNSASYPWPDMSNLWPGSTDRHVPGSGAPKNMLGMKFTNVLETAIDVISASEK
jgi:hypothetical protein